MGNPRGLQLPEPRTSKTRSNTKSLFWMQQRLARDLKLHMYRAGAPTLLIPIEDIFFWILLTSVHFEEAQLLDRFSNKKGMDLAK